MTFLQAFYMYILPLAISAACLVWLVYDKWQERRKDRLHPGE
ncbi:hypothetical protein FHW37_103238 [Neorhizobium alkalisoli]|jgi:hypothetical protein|uniref:Uncharacterized protein n=1 Tax=Neorhizobium alkalisoli TaxID=528178 RepID=A0A561QVI0_9HYPH|nr:hypothetical protein FHW37_103238 [Neorhizobium alkalisoli]